VNANRRLLKLLLPPDADAPLAERRYRLAALGALATVVSRLVGIGLILLTIRWAAPHFGAERFGIWATFSGLAAMLSFFDLGIGNALVNRVAHAAATNDSQQLARVVTGGLAWLVVIGACASLILAILGALIPWPTLFKLSNPMLYAETRNSAYVFSGMFGLNVISAGALKALTGQQRAYEAQLISTLSTLVAYPTTWFAITMADNVATLLLAGFGVQYVLTILQVVTLLAQRQQLFVRRLYEIMRSDRRELITTGSLFFVVQIGVAIGWGIDTFLLASIAGAADVASYTVAQRMFLFASQPVAILNGSLWAAYSDAYARGDRAFIRNTLRRSLTTSLAIGIGISLLLLGFGGRIASLWTNHSIYVSWELLFVFALWTPLESAGNSVACYLNGTGIVREQVFVVLAFCALALPAKLLATIHFGAVGMVAATALAYALTHIGLYGTIFRTRIFAPVSYQ
jgi:O-antigen/teichoic acid export membrane protein